LAEQPQVEHKKDKRAEMGKGREDSRADPNCIIRFLFRCIRHVTVTNISRSFRSRSDFQFTSQLSLQYCGFFTTIARTRSPLSSHNRQPSSIISNTRPPSSSSPPLSPSSLFMPVTFMSPFSESIPSTCDSEPTYHSSVGELPYPEWRLALADRAQKAGLGDVGTVMEWLMLAKDAGEPNSSEKKHTGKA